MKSVRLANRLLSMWLVSFCFTASANIGAVNPTLPATYGYDNLSRLTSYQQYTTAQSYGYDADGNRTTQTLGSTTTYNYASNSNRLTGIVHGCTTAVTDDANDSTTYWAVKWESIL